MAQHSQAAPLQDSAHSGPIEVDYILPSVTPESTSPNAHSSQSDTVSSDDDPIMCYVKEVDEYNKQRAAQEKRQERIKRQEERLNNYMKASKRAIKLISNRLRGAQTSLFASLANDIAQLKYRGSKSINMAAFNALDPDQKKSILALLEATGQPLPNINTQERQDSDALKIVGLRNSALPSLPEGT